MRYIAIALVVALSIVPTLPVSACDCEEHAADHARAAKPDEAASPRVREGTPAPAPATPGAQAAPAPSDDEPRSSGR